MLVEFAYAVLIDHVLHRCQLSALVPAHFFICIGSGSIFSLAFFIIIYLHFLPNLHNILYVCCYIFIYTLTGHFIRYTCSIAW